MFDEVFVKGNSLGFLYSVCVRSLRFCFVFFFNENLIRNLRLKIKLLISLRIHSYLFNRVQKSHLKKSQKRQAGQTNVEPYCIYSVTYSAVLKFPHIFKLIFRTSGTSCVYCG